MAAASDSAQPRSAQGARTSAQLRHPSRSLVSDLSWLVAHATPTPGPSILRSMQMTFNTPQHEGPWRRAAQRQSMGVEACAGPAEAVPGTTLTACTSYQYDVFTATEVSV